MSNYLEEAAEALRDARRKADGVLSHSEMAELHLRVADGFTRLAAIERGLLPPEMVPALASEPGGNGARQSAAQRLPE